MSKRYFLALALVTVLGLVAKESNPAPPPRHQPEHSLLQDKPTPADQKHHEDVNRRGDTAMGFSHLKTTHHFRLTSSGGSIEVQANDPGDRASLDQIRTHLQHIVRAFKDGDFSAPELTHGRVPPGVSTMQGLKSAIQYRYEETKTGGSVRISTTNPDALKAVHEYLRFQIEDHQTGDPKTVQR